MGQRERETKINASDSNVFARRQTEQVLGPLSRAPLPLLSRVECSAGRRGIAHKLWIIRDICQMQHISFILPSFLPPFLSIPLSWFVRSSVRPYREIDPRLLLLSLLPLSPRGACFFTHSCYMDGALWPILVHFSLFQLRCSGRTYTPSTFPQTDC